MKSATAATAAEKFGYSPARLGLIVQKLRERLGWTQAELAEDAEVSREVVAHLEQGKRRVFLDLVFKVAKALKVPVTALLAVAAEEETPLKRGDRVLLLFLPQQEPVLAGRYLSRCVGGHRVRIEGGAHKGSYIMAGDDEVRRVP